MLETKNNLNIDSEIYSLYLQAKEDTKDIFSQIEDISLYNQKKVLDSFIKRGVSEYHLHGSTGYGLSDPGRETLEDIYCDIFKTQKSIVRANFVSGTHAIGVVFYGILTPGDNFISITGKPYETLANVIGDKSSPGTLIASGIEYKEIDLIDNKYFDKEKIKKEINDKTKMVFIQRSCGYSPRRSNTVREIEDITKFIKSVKEDIIVFVDNCYGELVEEKEPTEAGVDICAGSLIKNLGAGIAPCGGYITGREDLVKLCAKRYTIPHLEDNLGATLNTNRLLYQGLFMAPSVVANCVKSSIIASYIFEKLGYETFPKFNEQRTDIICAVKLGNKELLSKFCQTIQNNSPVDSKALLKPHLQPGYSNPIIMASGSFTQGSSIELSADGPVQEPYIAYLQGGLSYEHSIIAILRTAENLNYKS
ncbi:MAG: methionine gamma-lyase family protein [Armatimonadota bacterium]